MDQIKRTVQIKKDVVFRCVRLLVRGRSKSRETQLGAENGHAHPQLTYPTTGPSLHSSSSSPAKSPASSPGTTRIPLAAPPRVPRPLPPSLRLPRHPPSSSWRSKCPLLAAAAPRPLLRRGPAAAAAGAGGAPGVRPQADEAGAHRFQDPPFPGLPLASLLRSVQASSEALELMLNLVMVGMADQGNYPMVLQKVACQLHHRSHRCREGIVSFAIDFLMGGVSAVVSKTAVAPIECAELLIQNQDEIVKAGHIFESYKETTDSFA
ncbi:hypothetical protein OPV22_034199 [Ensete ventricosum]|uniref:ADP/ATP translocase n=1 Tax=Ensete ventricosum TaxID=4639 RepID=A0AAV8PWD1_ENSVE|nr:hypothetical protein OPV22_034199 [Ensete ventricosum]